VRKRKFAAGRFANGQDTRARDGDSGRRTITELRRPTVDRAAVVDANQSLQLERRTFHSPTLSPPPPHPRPWACHRPSPPSGASGGER